MAGRGPPQQDAEAQWLNIPSIGRLNDIRGVSAHGDLVWVTGRGSYDGNVARGRVVVFQRTTDDKGLITHTSVAECFIDSPDRIAAHDKVAWVSLEQTGDIQELRLNGRAINLTHTFHDAKQLADPKGLAYNESTNTLYVCCKDGVKAVRVAGRNVARTLAVRGADLPRPLSVSVLGNKILVVGDQNHLMMYTNEEAEGTILHPKNPPEGQDIAHNGKSFLVPNMRGGSIWKRDKDWVNKDWVKEYTLPPDSVKPLFLSCVLTRDNQCFLYVVGYNTSIVFYK